jgi:hypothetical protein
MDRAAGDYVRMHQNYLRPTICMDIGPGIVLAVWACGFVLHLSVSATFVA